MFDFMNNRMAELDTILANLQEQEEAIRRHGEESERFYNEQMQFLNSLETMSRDEKIEALKAQTEKK